MGCQIRHRHLTFLANYLLISEHLLFRVGLTRALEQFRSVPFGLYSADRCLEVLRGGCFGSHCFSHFFGIRTLTSLRLVGSSPETVRTSPRDQALGSEGFS